MRIAIFGVGGVGGYFGGRLARAGHDVVFIARGGHLEAMKSRGLRVDSIDGDFVVDPVRATDDPSSTGHVDAVIVAVKTWSVPDAARSMAPMVGPSTVVLPLENGVEAAHHLSQVLGREHVLGGLCRIISFIEGPGHIRHTGLPPQVELGEQDNRTRERTTRLKDALEQAGIKARIPDDIHVSIWTKFINLAPFSGVASVTGAPAGVLAALPETRRMVKEGMEEIFSVAAAHGIHLPDDIVERSMTWFEHKLPPGSTTSMQRDIMAGRPSELESQNGAVVRLGKEASVPTPVNSFIYGSLLPREMRARGTASFDL